MTMFDPWCSKKGPAPFVQGATGRAVSTIDSVHDATGVAVLAAMLPGAYADTTALALIAQQHGKPGTSKFLRDRLPTKKSARSGDMGEILATAYLAEEHSYTVGPSRLIDRDHQEWAMRGDDVLAARVDSHSKVHIVKAEAKSRVTLGKTTVEQAREGLHRNSELPSPHSLSQFATRLLRSADKAIGEAVLRVQLTTGVRSDQVTHLMFLLTAGDPSVHVTADLHGYSGTISQLTVTLRVQEHQKFINDAFDAAIANVP